MTDERRAVAETYQSTICHSQLIAAGMLVCSHWTFVSASKYKY